MVAPPKGAPAAPQATRYIELDGLKGVSTTFVVAAHIDIRPVFWAWSWMDMFFVLSSFLLTRIVHKKCTDMTGVIAYYGRRIERIWPLYLLTISVLLVVTWAINHRYDTAVFDLTVFARLFTFSQYSEMMFHPVAGYDYIYYTRHLWSLAIEEQFYVVLPLGMLLLRRTPLVIWLPTLLAVVVLSTVQRVAHPNMYILTSHMDAFALGSLLALSLPLLSANLQRANWLLLCTAVLSLALFSPYLFSGYASLLDDGTVPGYEAWPALFSALFWVSVIGLLALNRGSGKLSLMRFGALVHFGNLSYAVYLIHYPILKLLPGPMMARVDGLSLLSAELLCLPLILLLAEVLYRTIDRPLQLKRPSNVRGIAASSQAPT